MASCSGPDFPAVAFALEHLKELDKQLSEGGVPPFSREASLHLTEIAAAVAELEADRRAAREHLEVETIENSKLRLHINSVRETLSREIMADAAAARASDAEETERLQKELNAVSQMQEATERRTEALLGQNQALRAERELVRVEHGDTVAALNDQITIKYGLQMQLERTAERTEEFESRAAAATRDKIALRQRAALEREAFAARRGDLSAEKERIDEEFARQEPAVGSSRRELVRVNGLRRQTRERLEELASREAELESDLRTRAASRRQRAEQLEGETLKRRELRRQRDGLEEELRALREELGVHARRLEEDAAALDVKIEEEQASRYVWQDSMSALREALERRRGEEDEVRAAHRRVSQQLLRRKQQLEEHVASVVEHRAGIGEMDRRLAELLEADAINRRVFGRSREEMRVNADAESRNVGRLGEEKERLQRLLDEAKKRQEEHVVKMTRDLDGVRRRYRDLQREEAELRRRQPRSADTDALMSHVTQCEAEYRGEESRLLEETEQCAAETESTARSAEEKRREAEEEEERLKEVEARWSEERSRHRRMEMQTSDLRRRRSDLKLSIRSSEEEIVSLLEPREKMKAELEEMRRRHMEVLRGQAPELRAAEASIYDGGAKVEEVRLENSRLQLRVRQMTDDLGGAVEDRDRYRRESLRVGRDARVLLESLHRAWAEDASVTDHCLRGDAALLGLLRAADDHQKTRSERIGGVDALLRRLMVDFSKQLGHETSAEAHLRDSPADPPRPLTGSG